MKFESPIIEIKGVGRKTEEMFHKEGVYTIGDILLRFPKDYTRMPEIKEASKAIPGNYCSILAKVTSVPQLKRGKSAPVVFVHAADQSAHFEIRWFHMPYMKHQITKGETYVFYGKIQVPRSEQNSLILMEQPVIFSKEEYRSKCDVIQPVYDKISGISNQMMQKYLTLILEEQLFPVDHMPLTIIEKRNLTSYGSAISQIHFPGSMEELVKARERLVYDEFFQFLLTIRMQKEKETRKSNAYPIQNHPITDSVLKKLPYELTNAQKNCLKEVLADLKGSFCMHRLIQGDVGSGKTIIAYLSMLSMSENGYQSALMAPTEVLAAQHYETFTKLNKAFTIENKLILLTGSQTARQRKEAYEQIQTFPDAMIIGTQALIQEKAEYSNLGLVISDEQHRFGVRQRELFAKKGADPHILVMSATPIPRTLAIILYGDLDISVIDELPAKRLPNKNCVVNKDYRKTAYEFIRKEVVKGHQAYVICPLVEESENYDAEDVENYSKRLSAFYGDDIKIGRLDGKMKGSDKNEIMERFSDGEISVLVCTTVVEVGVNVPNATVMLIENADRFGLAQLHQLRGRVGRGDAQSYCIMINTSDKETAQKRLEILNQSNDGFFIASEDLKLRGPGDFFGIRQSGELGFVIADIYQDSVVLKNAVEDMEALFERDPKLTMEENKHAAQFIERQIVASAEKMTL
ncbi:MAG: ATP-dependent DNA helicase RecG [Lachnospiraceae bacterium]